MIVLAVLLTDILWLQRTAACLDCADVGQCKCRGSQNWKWKDLLLNKPITRNAGLMKYYNQTISEYNNCYVKNKIFLF